MALIIRFGITHFIPNRLRVRFKVGVSDKVKTRYEVRLGSKVTIS